MAHGSGGADRTVTAFAPGRVNLVGDHTDHAGGRALPMAIDLGTTVTGVRVGSDVTLVSDDMVGEVAVSLDPGPSWSPQPAWARTVAAVVGEVRPTIGLHGRVRTTLPIGAGLSSSAALEVALALALGAPEEGVALARLAQRAEHAATGVPTGLMDQLCATSGVAGHALLIDFSGDDHQLVALPDTVEVVVVHSGEQRALETTAYAARRDEIARATAAIGPLRDRPSSDADELRDPVLRRRARHVICENARVLAMAEALRTADAVAAGAIMAESHASLRDDLEVSTPGLDAAVAALVARPGVLGARLTGAGFGGCAVAVTELGAVADPAAVTGRGWRVLPSAGAWSATG